MVNGVITKQEWDDAELLEDKMLEFETTEECKRLKKIWCQTNSEEDYKKIRIARKEFLKRAGCLK